MNYLHLSKWALAGGAALLFTACGDEAEETFTAESEQTPTSAEPSERDISLESADQKVSYGLGYNLGASIASQGGLDADVEAIMAGVEDGLAMAETRIPEDELRTAFMSLRGEDTGASSAAAEENLAEAKQWLAENAEREEVEVTASGLQYEVLESGPEDGESPGPNDTVEVHYHGTLLDGTVFDSSVERGESIGFPVNRVIAGWTEALQLMSVGDKWKLYIPPELAYGSRRSGQIPPNSALVFEVELLDVE